VFFTLNFIGILNNRLFTVDFKLLQLVAQHAFNRLAFVALGNRLYDIGNGVILQLQNKFAVKEHKPNTKSLK
jgi:hypothetical protein